MTTDHSESLRVQKTYQMLNKTDIAILVVDGTIGMTEEDLALLETDPEKTDSLCHRIQ